jgi:hypothetical protein
MKYVINQQRGSIVHHDLGTNTACNHRITYGWVRVDSPLTLKHYAETTARDVCSRCLKLMPQDVLQDVPHDAPVQKPVQSPASIIPSLITYRDNNPYKHKTYQWYGWYNSFDRVIRYLEGRTPLNPVS